MRAQLSHISAVVYNKVTEDLVDGGGGGGEFHRCSSASTSDQSGYGITWGPQILLIDIYIGVEANHLAHPHIEHLKISTLQGAT